MSFVNTRVHFDKRTAHVDPSALYLGLQKDRSITSHIQGEVAFGSERDTVTTPTPEECHP